MTLLTVRNLKTHFATDRGVVRSVDGVSFNMERGEVLGLVGESGSGKSVTALSIMRLIRQPPGRITADELTFDGIELLRVSDARMRDIRTARIGMVFQDPMRSLNPVLTIGRQLEETVRRHLGLSRTESRDRAVELMEMVGIPMASARLKAYPHEFSGGMRQRVMIAIALSCNPSLLIADEATTALDVTIQAQIVDLVKRLVADLGIAVLWISHDLGLVANLCDRVNVMYAGRIVESGPVRDIFKRPSHGYTLGLLASTPRLDQVGERLVPIDGFPPDLREEIPFCPFLPRCRVSVAQCAAERPQMEPQSPGHMAACFADLHPNLGVRA